MLENRKILVGLLGIIIGIIIGLYCKISIALFYIILISIYLIFHRNSKSEFKLISLKRYSRYIKIIFTRNVIKVIIIFSIISNTIVLYQENRFENLYKDLEDQNCNLTGIIEKVESSKNRIKVKIIDEDYKNSYLYLYINDCTIENMYNTKNTNILEYGDKINFTGTFSKPSVATNYGGFDYSKYLKTLKIYGIINTNNIKIISKNNGNIIFKYINKINAFLENRIENSILSDDEKALVKGIILGNKEDISDDLQNEFSVSNISYVLVASGMHVSYVVIISNFVFNKTIGKRLSKMFSIVLIFIYMCIVGFTPSILRAGIVGIIALFGNLFYRKNDIYTALSLSLFIILILNPYLITSIGVQLSFAGTLGIIIIGKNISKFIDYILERKTREFIRRNEIIKIKFMKLINSKILSFIRNATIVTLSTTLIVIPIILLNYNTVSITSLFISIITSFLIPPIMVFGILFFFFKFKLIQIFLSVLLKILIFLSNLGSNLPLNQIYLITPNLFQILIYYIILFSINFYINIKLDKKSNMFYKRISNLLNLLKFKINQQKKRVISIFMIVILISSFFIIIPKNLKLYFVDVGQGDCTMIVTPRNKKILIDGRRE